MKMDLDKINRTDVRGICVSSLGKKESPRGTDE